MQAQGRMRELIIRMMYCEMLGHRVEFGYIHAVNMAQRPAITEKRTGYLAATLFLDSSRRAAQSVCCSVVQWGAVGCSGVQCGAVWCGVVRCGAVWCKMVQWSC